MGGPKVKRFLSSLAVQGRVAANTQNQGLSARLFLYRQLLTVDLPWLENVVRVKRSQRVPTMLSREEVQRLLAALERGPFLPEAGYDLRTIKELLGHKGVSRTQIYTHVLNRVGRGVLSPLDG